jgi:hypothetical protein
VDCPVERSKLNQPAERPTPDSDDVRARAGVGHLGSRHIVRPVSPAGHGDTIDVAVGGRDPTRERTGDDAACRWPVDDADGGGGR